MATETLPDHKALRYARRERALAAMEAHDLDLLVVGRVANIRYVSGVPVLWNAGTRPFGPGAVLVRSTGEVHLMSTWDEGVPEEIPHDHLYGITWNPMNYVAVLGRIGADVRPRRVGTDATSPLFAQLLPMAFPGAAIVDGGPALRHAKRVKTNEEVDAIRGALGVAEAGLAAAVAELRPGVSERELAGVFVDAMATHGVTTPATQDVVRITTAPMAPTAPTAPTTRAARGAGRDGRVQAGDLVAFDAGVVADGYTGEVGRTWPAEPQRAAGSVRDLYDRWERLWERLLHACQPGAAGSDLLEAYEATGEPLPQRPIGRGLGLGFDDPVIVGDLPDTAAHERLDPGVVLLLTGSVTDDRATVVAHEAVLIAPDGPVVLSGSPFWNRERGGVTT
jgi:Xaa-Pro dipeptidase